MRFTFFAGNHEFISDDFYEYSNDNKRNCTARQALEGFRKDHERHIQKHKDAIEIIDTILATDGPEAAMAKAKAELEEAHPTGLHHKCNCTHTADIRIGKPLAQAVAGGTQIALPAGEFPPAPTFWKKVKVFLSQL